MFQSWLLVKLHLFVYFKLYFYFIFSLGRLSRGNVGAGSPSFGGMRTSIGGGSPNVKKGFSFSQSFYDDRYPGEEQNETETVSSTTSQSTGSYKGIQGIDDVEKHPSRGSNASTTFPKSPRASVGEYYANKVDKNMFCIRSIIKKSSKNLSKFLIVDFNLNSKFFNLRRLLMLSKVATQQRGSGTRTAIRESTTTSMMLAEVNNRLQIPHYPKPAKR